MNDRIGDYLWHEWDGDLYEQSDAESTVYYTFEHIDLSIDVIRRGLASAIQRDGVANSLGDAFKALELSIVVHSWAGSEEDGMNLCACDASGETFYGDVLENIQEITFVEIKCF
jgi:hypothetical protein